MNWSDSSRLSTTRKLIHKLRSPRLRAIIGVLPMTRSAPLFAADSRILESIRSSLSNPILLQVSIGITLETAHVYNNPRSCVFFQHMSNTCADTSASVPRCMASYFSIAQCPMDLTFSSSLPAYIYPARSSRHVIIVFV